MWPWGHLAVGYLLYTVGCRRYGRRPEANAVFLLAIGTQFPDLVDKPLAWTFGVLESGRSLGHSMLVAVVVLAVLYVVLVPRLGRRPYVAFAVGYLSHQLADLPVAELLAGRVTDAAYLVWPIAAVPASDPPTSILAYFLTLELGPFEWFQFLLLGVATVSWYRDGVPGWHEFRGVLARLAAPIP